MGRDWDKCFAIPSGTRYFAPTDPGDARQSMGGDRSERIPMAGSATSMTTLRSWLTTCCQQSKSCLRGLNRCRLNSSRTVRENFGVRRSH